MINVTLKKEDFTPLVRLQPQGMKIAFGYRDLLTMGEDGIEVPSGLGTWTEHTFTSDRSSYQIKEFILAELNRRIDEEILSGFTWKDMPIWLSSENQFNYKAAYDLAVQSGGTTLPVVFKFGTSDSPVYYTFESLDDIHDFYLSAIRYITDTLAAGWSLKDSIDWSAYRVDL